MATLQRGLEVLALLLANLVDVLDLQPTRQDNQECLHLKDRVRVNKATVAI